MVVGMGWAGGIIAAELAKAGLSVVGLERGPDRPADGEEFTRKHDELRYRVRHGLMQDVGRETWTFRHHDGEAATPMRHLGAFLPGTGVGGSSTHYGGNTARFAPWEFEMRSRTVERYGEDAIPAGSTIQDWGLTYDELEPYYDRFEWAAGVAGRAGSNPFEGRRSRDFPLRCHPDPETSTLFGEACAGLGHHPFPMPLAILSEEYTNPDGVRRGACVQCGDCAHFTCAVDARGDARVVSLPVARRSPKFELRADAEVLRVLHDGRRANGVVYQVEDGTVEEQPAGMVVLAAYTFNNVRLLLTSGLGRPYDAASGDGVVGKNYAYHVHALGTAFFSDRTFKKYMGAGGGGQAITDFAADNFDHSDAGFIGGAQVMVASGGGAIGSLAVPPGTPSWGAAWKDAIRRWYDRSLSVSALGNVLAYRANHLDLDPTYTDSHGDPLLRITFDWQPNELAIASFAEARIREILTAMEPDHLVTAADSGHFDTVPYQGTHNTGGAIMGAEPRTSVVNSWQQMWDCENLWVVGGSAFPQNGTPGPTGTICALAYRAAEGMQTYAQRPGMLA
ncbi:MAG: gluconate 2-dehydrogenase alpha chain [Chloroflexota bacterium]|nr:gluconate 2-dehydrogenase alpha chain [Chloroflexota bacterium]